MSRVSVARANYFPSREGKLEKKELISARDRLRAGQSDRVTERGVAY